MPELSDKEIKLREALRLAKEAHCSDSTVAEIKRAAAHGDQIQVNHPTKGTLLFNIDFGEEES